MDYITVLTTREVRNESDGIGLGWLLALVIGGGVLLFTAIGLLLAWRIRSQGQQCTTRVYAMDDPTPTGEYEMQPGRIDSTRDSSYFGGLGSLTASSTTRLVKKRVAESASSSWSRMSSKTFLPGQVPPVLPPLPTYNSFLGRGIFLGKGWEGGSTEESNGGNGSGSGSGSGSGGGERPRTRTRMESITDWIDEEALHGPVIKRMSFRDSWFSKDSWMLRSPTLPSLVDAIVGSSSKENKEAEQTQQAKQTDSQPHTQPIQVPKRQDKINTSLTAPELSFQPKSDGRGRQRVIAQTQNPPVRPSATETDLRDILASTEQRLRDGISRSSTKRITPSRSGRAGTPGRMTPSQSKRNVTTTTGTPTPSPSKKTGLSRDASVSSIGSAANSLIRAATEELELEMTGAGSLRRRRGSKEWEPLRPKPSQQQKEVEELAQRRRRSLSTDSDASSSLSTLYSVGESEDRDHPGALPAASATAQRNVDDPFYNDLGGQGGRLQLMGPRPLRRSKTVNAAPRTMTDESAIPAPLRTISVNPRVGRAGVKDSFKNESFRVSLLRQLPKPTMAAPSLPEGVVKPEENLVAAKRESLSAASSESSMVSVSVHTESTVTDLPPRSRDESSPTPPPAPSSGAIDLSMLVMNANSRPRNLPTPPPSRIFALRDSSSLTMTPLSPRPRSRHGPTPPPSTTNSAQQLPCGPTASASSSSGGLGAFPAHSRRTSTSSSVYDQESVSTAIFEDDMAGNTPPPPPPPRVPAGLGLKTVGSTVAELRKTYSTYSVASASSMYFR